MYKQTLYGIDYIKKFKWILQSQATTITNWNFKDFLLISSEIWFTKSKLQFQKSIFSFIIPSVLQQLSSYSFSLATYTWLIFKAHFTMKVTLDGRVMPAGVGVDPAVLWIPVYWSTRLHHDSNYTLSSVFVFYSTCPLNMSDKDGLKKLCYLCHR